jgi:hypothetical protein
MYEQLSRLLLPACAVAVLVCILLTITSLKMLQRTPRQTFRAAVKDDVHAHVVYDDCMDTAWTEDAVARIVDAAQEERVVGMDCEWKPERRGCSSKVAVLQVRKPFMRLGWMYSSR